MESIINQYGMKLLSLVLAFICGKAGYEVGKLAVKYIRTEILQMVAEKSMQYVEQVYKLIHGEEKMEKALETARTMLGKLGLKFDAKEMRILIEAAVCAFNEGLQKGKNASAALQGNDNPEADPETKAASFEDEKEYSGLLEE